MRRTAQGKATADPSRALLAQDDKGPQCAARSDASTANFITPQFSKKRTMSPLSG
jgi:hypothetical protein